MQDLARRIKAEGAFVESTVTYSYPLNLYILPIKAVMSERCAYR